MTFTSPEFFSPVFPNHYRSENITLNAKEILYGYKPESTRFCAFNHYPLIPRYYIHLARNKSENPKQDVFIVLLEIKIQCEREKPKNHTKCRNKWTALCISDMRCDLSALFFVGVFSFIYLACFTILCSSAMFSGFYFLFSVNYMACLFYYCIPWLY